MKIILSGTDWYVVLTEKGVNWINWRGDSWTTGLRADFACQSRYINSKTTEQDLKRKKLLNSDQKQPSLEKRRSNLSFEFKTYCLCCCQTITERDFKNLKFFQVMSKNKDFNKKGLAVCCKRDNALTILVKRIIRFTTDLDATDGLVYHTAYNSSFRTDKNLRIKTRIFHQ